MTTLPSQAASSQVFSGVTRSNLTSSSEVPMTKTDSPAKDIVSPTAVDTSHERAISMEDVAEAVAMLQEAVDIHTPSMSIGFDGELNKVVVRVMDSETNELIRELPPEEVLRIARFLERYGTEAVGTESLKGMLLDDYV